MGRREVEITYVRDGEDVGQGAEDKVEGYDAPGDEGDYGECGHCGGVLVCVGVGHWE